MRAREYTARITLPASRQPRISDEEPGGMRHGSSATDPRRLDDIQTKEEKKKGKKEREKKKKGMPRIRHDKSLIEA